jgi:hypothetical protein
MTEQKRTRAPKQLSPADILVQIGKLPLKDRVTLLSALKKNIEEEKKAMQEQIELINNGAK